MTRPRSVTIAARIPEQVDAHIPPAHLYAQTGIQRMPINTLYQLASMRESQDPQLAAAADRRGRMRKAMT